MSALTWERTKMVKSITFSKVAPSKANYMAELPCLIGKTFEFKPGANILCGYNGCGKTSIIKAIRAMTFCERKRYSSVNRSTFASMHINEMIDKYYELVDLQNDWRYSVFSCRPNNEIDSANFTDDTGTFSQFFASNDVSAGMGTFMALNQLLHDLSESAPNGGNCKIRDFWTNVMKVNLSEHFGNWTLDNASDADGIGRVKKYTMSHQVTAPGITALIDEPDASADILFQDCLYRLICKFTTGVNSFIIVLHSASLLYKLKRTIGDKINWIELTPGYLDNLTNLIEGREVICPEHNWWLHPKFNKKTKGETK